MPPAPVMPSARQRARALQKPATRRLAPVRPIQPGEAEETDDGGVSGLAIWLPTLLGIGLAFLAAPLWDRLQSAWGEVGVRCVFPYLLLCGRPELGISRVLASNLSQLMLYLQFPLEGLIVTWGLARGIRPSKAFAQLLFLHGLGVFVLWLLSQPLVDH